MHPILFLETDNWLDRFEIKYQKIELLYYFVRTNSRDCDKSYTEGADMKDLPHSLFSRDDDLSPQDDIDQLFLQLESINPPSSLVDTILTSVARLPQHEFLPDVDEATSLWQGVEDLIVSRSRLQPS